MNTTGKVIASLCIFSTLLMGCYSTALIELSGSGKDHIKSADIKFVVMNDSTKQFFDGPPAIVADTIIGLVNRVTGHLEVSIPASDVAQLYESHYGKIERVVTNSGINYTFEKPPAFDGNLILGEAKERVFLPAKVAFPVSGVRQIGVREFEAGATVVLVTVGALVLAKVIYDRMKPAKGDTSGGGGPNPGGPPPWWF
jgi:hypothetical protein